MSLILPTRKLIKKAIPIVLCAPLILPITAVKGKELGMFMPLMAAPAAGKYTAPPSTIPLWKGFKTTTGSTPANTPITYASCDIGTAHVNRIIIVAQASQDGQTAESFTVGGTTVAMSWWQNISGINIEMGWLAIDSSYGTTTSFVITSNVIQATHQMCWWICYPNNTNIIEGDSAEQTTTTAASQSWVTEDGGFLILGGIASVATGLTGSVTAGTGTLAKDGENQNTRTLAGYTVSGTGAGSVTAQVVRDIGGSGWKAIAGFSLGRFY